MSALDTRKDVLLNEEDQHKKKWLMLISWFYSRKGPVYFEIRTLGYSSFSAFRTGGLIGRRISFGFWTFGKIFLIWRSDSLFLQKFSHTPNKGIGVPIMGLTGWMDRL